MMVFYKMISNFSSSMFWKNYGEKIPTVQFFSNLLWQEVAILAFIKSGPTNW